MGVLIGGGIGAFTGYLLSREEDEYLGFAIAVSAGIGVVIGLLSGVFYGVYKGKVISFESKSQKEINKILSKLSQKARIRDYK